MLLALVFGSIFLTVLFAMSSYVLVENKLQTAQTDKSKGLAIAEAGVEYYKWHLAHFPNDLQNGTGAAGPYSIPYTDPEGGQTGTISLTVNGNNACGNITSVDLQSVGTPTGSGSSATIYARYARPSVAQYSYIINDSVWAGADRIISGPYHSNGGVRMDGTANAPVTSSLATWSCTSSYGCSPTATKNGVFGSGPNQTLWSYPTPQIDFTAIAADFTSIKNIAIAQGRYFTRYSSGTSGVSAFKGYHLVFNANNTVTVYTVSNEYNTNIGAAIDGSSDTSDYARIRSESLVGTYAISATCPLIYVEDNVWIEGTVASKVTVVAANTVTAGVSPNAMIPNNITYTSSTGSAGLTLIAENDILITPDSPNNLTINGIFIAQGGAFGRNYYGCPSAFEPRGTLTLTGTTVSNKRTGTKWVNGCGGGSDAGYQTRIDSFDRKLSTSPPPFTPFTSTDYKFVDWRQK
ncbi:MAG: hypothetical protein JWO84_308 [Parcubacteria group bacterium]|nr:hypothetical protein [Parcubacteria group bacterium]